MRASESIFRIRYLFLSQSVSLADNIPISFKMAEQCIEAAKIFQDASDPRRRETKQQPSSHSPVTMKSKK